MRQPQPQTDCPIKSGNDTNKKEVGQMTLRGAGNDINKKNRTMT